jgi:hypothetical protein
MFIRGKCPKCNEVFYQDLIVQCEEHHITFEDNRQMSYYLVKNLDVKETVSEEEMAQSVIRELKGYVYNGITVRELYHTLQTYFGVVAIHCCDLIQRIKIDLDMYCPDREHLYYVNS